MRMELEPSKILEAVKQARFAALQRQPTCCMPLQRIFAVVERLNWGNGHLPLGK